ncbi:hypothetical protein BSKO_04049 [Bryopsis sp. KO-2023]|nr:hypothetical protein BSKO_04049 [Bryopsis sp. KO-2023]
MRFFWNSGVLLAIGMAFLFSLDSALTARVSKTVPLFEYAVASGIIKWAATLVINAISKESLCGRKQDLRLVMLPGVLYGSFLICLYGSLGLIPLVDSVGLFYMNPVVCAILGRIFFKDPFGPPSILGLALVVAGVLLLNGSSFLFQLGDVVWDARKIVGVTLGVCSALGAGVAFTVIRGLRNSVSPGVISTWAFTFQTLLAIPPMLLGFPGRAVIIDDPATIAFTLIAALSSCFGGFFACRACQLIPAGLSTSIETTLLIWGLLWSFLFFDHAITWQDILGVVFIIVGAFSVGMDGPMKSFLMDWFSSINPWASKQKPAKEKFTEAADEGEPLLAETL